MSLQANTLNNKKSTTNWMLYLFSFLSSAIGIGLNFFLAKELEADLYGRVQYYVAIATTCSQFLIFGLNSFLIREAKNPSRKNEIVNSCFSIYLAVGLFLLPIIYFFLSKKIDGTISNTLLIVSILVVSFLMGVNSLVASFLQGSGKFHVSILIESLLPKTILLIISIIFIVLKKKTLIPDFYLLFYIGTYLLISFPFLFKFFRKFECKLQKEDFKSIFFFFGVTITYSLGNNLTKVLQGGLYKNDVALAIISVSLSLVSLIRVFTGVIDGMVKPIFAKLKRENDFNGLLDMYRFDTRMNSYVAIPLYLFFIFHSSKFLYLFGESYLAYTNILVIIASANAVSDLTGPNGTLLAMTGKEKWELFNGFLYFAVYIALVFILSFDSVYGLSLALLVALVCVNIAKYVEVWVFYHKAPLDAKTIYTLLFILIVNAGIIFAIRFIDLNILLWFVICIPIGIAIVALNCFVLSLYRKKDIKTFIGLRL